jgi:hypothetical protein
MSEVENIRNQTAVTQKKVQILPGGDSADYLRLVSWAILISGVFGGLYVVFTLGGVQSSSYLARKDPVIIGYGIGLIIGSIFTSVLCHTVAAISDNVRTIAKNSIKD